VILKCQGCSNKSNWGSGAAITASSNVALFLCSFHFWYHEFPKVCSAFKLARSQSIPERFMAGYYLVGLATDTGLVHHCSAVDGAAPLMAPLSTSVSPTRQQLVTRGTTNWCLLITCQVAVLNLERHNGASWLTKTLEFVSSVLVHRTRACGKISVAAAQLAISQKHWFSGVLCWKKLPSATCCWRAVSIAHVVAGVLVNEYTGFEA